MLKKIPFLLLALLFGALLWSVANANAGGSAAVPDDLRSRYIFRIMDSNEDSVLTPQEFSYSFVTGKVTDEKLLPDERFSLLDVNKDGIISLDEFRNGWNRGVEEG